MLDVFRLREYDSNQSFDPVIAPAIVEHLPKQGIAEFLSEAGLRLRGGGWLAIQTQNLGSIQGAFVRFNELTHEFRLTEKDRR